MSDALGPHRTLQKQRREKPYDRPASQKQHLRRSASFVDSVKAIVTKPFAWLRPPNIQAKPIVDSTEDDRTAPSHPPSFSTTSLQKRPASPTHDKHLVRSPKKQRRASPLLNGFLHSDRPLRSSVSAPFLSSSHLSGSRTRADLPPLPRLTPSRKPFTDSSRLISPSLRASPAASVRRPLPARRSVIPDPVEGDVFGLSYRSPFIRPSPAPIPTDSRQSSIFSDLPRPRASLAADDQRMRTVSPYRSTPLGSPTRRAIDIPQSLALPPRSASIARSESMMSFGTPSTPLPAAFRNPPLTSSMSWQPALGPLSSVESMARTQSVTSAPPSSTTASPEHTSTDSIFKALEGALPWSEARKLRLDQRASVKVPAPSAASARAGRMIKPYARTNGLGSDSHDAGVERKGLLTSLSEKRNAAEKARLEKSEGTSKSRKPNPSSFVNGATESSREASAEPKNGENGEDMEDDKDGKMDTSMGEPPAEAQKKAGESGLAPPVSLPPPSTSFDVAGMTKGSPRREASSLRVGRTKMSAFAHTPSAPLRRPNRFGVVDDEDSDGDGREDDGLPGAQELNEWAMRSGISMTIPVGWSLSGETSVPKTIATEEKGGGANGDTKDSDTDTATTSQDKPKGKPTPFPHSLPSALKGSSEAPGAPPTSTTAGTSEPQLSAFPPPGLAPKPFAWSSGAPSIDIKATSLPSPWSFPSASSESAKPASWLAPPTTSSLVPATSSSLVPPGTSLAPPLEPPSSSATNLPFSLLPSSTQPSSAPNLFAGFGQSSKVSEKKESEKFEPADMPASESTPSFAAQPSSSSPPTLPTDDAPKDGVKPPAISGFGGFGAFGSKPVENNAESTSAPPKPSSAFNFSTMPSPSPGTATTPKADEPAKTSAFSFSSTTMSSSNPSPFSFASFSKPVASTPNESTTSPAADSPSATSTTSTPTASPFASFSAPAAVPKSVFSFGQPSAKPSNADGNAPTASPTSNPFSFGTSVAAPASSGAGENTPSNPFAFGSKPSAAVEAGSKRAATFSFQPITTNGSDGTPGASTPPAAFGTGFSSRSASTSAVSFGFGAPIAGGEKVGAFAGTPPSTPPIRPSAFSFDMSKPAESTTPAPIFGNGGLGSRPKTPPTEQSVDADAGMELSPERTIPSTESTAASFTPALVTNSSPFGFGLQSSAFGPTGAITTPKPAFTFGSSQSSNASSNPFAASVNRPPAFGAPSAFGSTAVSPFGQPQSLPSISPFGLAAPSNGVGSFPSSTPVFGGVGSGNSSPVTATTTPPSQPAFGFTFSASPAGSPTLSPVQASASAPPFVFGASSGSDAESQPKPPTPTTPRRAVKGLPNRRAKR